MDKKEGDFCSNEIVYPLPSW